MRKLRVLIALWCAVQPMYALDLKEKISLHFQDIEIRRALQIFSEFAGVNVVISDSVTGNVTLQLNHIPWEDALDAMLHAKGLGKQFQAGVLIIGPLEELAAKDQLRRDLEEKEELWKSLESMWLYFQYAKAERLYQMLTQNSNALLSKRGVASYDSRMNAVFVKDTHERLAAIKKFKESLDVPVKQVAIEVHIVEANENLDELLGFRYRGTLQAAIEQDKDKWLFDSSRAEGFGTASFKIGHIAPNTALELELQAIEREAKAKVLSRPTVTTLNHKAATIESGKELPFLSSSANTGTNTTFKKALTRLHVTPHIMPNQRIALSLEVNKDTVDLTTMTVEQAGPGIDTQRLDTKITVADGETIVLGGLYTDEKRDKLTKVPWLGDLPVVGWLFRSKRSMEQRKELLIFVTPRIVDDAF